MPSFDVNQQNGSQKSRLVPEVNNTVTQETTLSLNVSSLIESFRCRRFRLLKRIPKASRIQAADKLSSLLSVVTANSDDVNSWIQLLMFTKCCLKVPDNRGGKKLFDTSLATKVNKNIAAFPSSISIEVQSSDSYRQNQKSSHKVDPQQFLARRVSEKIEDGDVRGAIRLAASDDHLAPVNSTTLAALQAKHPSKAQTSSDCRLHADQMTASNVNSSLTVQRENILAAIRSFPNGSAGGLDGLRPQHLKEMTSSQCGHAGEHLIDTLTTFANKVLDGQVPDAIKPFFCGASLFALSKKDGGIRPIAVGCTLRRLVAKIVVNRVSAEVATILAPHQLGVGIKLATEAAAHASRTYINNLTAGQAVLKLDFNNAFNSLHRDIMLMAVKNYLPHLRNYVELCYAQPSELYFGNEIIMSEEGAQQGDPLGSMLFCLAIQPIVVKLSSEFNVWYIDDGTIGGNQSDILHDIHIIKAEGEMIGLTLNETKCELITSNLDVVHAIRAVLPSVTHVDPRDAIVLGAPVGGDIIIDTVLFRKLKDFRRLAERLKHLNTHDAFYLLKHCFSLPMLMYTLRSAPCYDSELINQYDESIRSTLQAILNVSLTDDGWRQAKLPVKHGGLGVLSASDIALPAFLASVFGSAELSLQLLPSSLTQLGGTNDVKYNHYVDKWRSITMSPTPDASIAANQKVWSRPLQVIAAEAVLSAAQTQASRARLIAAAAPSSGAFLQAIPMSSVGTRLDNTSMRIAVSLRLGAPLCTPHDCICGAAVDSSGVHGLSCRKSAGRGARHTAINSIVKAALTSAEIPSRLEPRGLARDDGKRPDGVTSMPWRNGRCLIWDVTCPDTLAASYLDKAVSGPGVVATEAETRKRHKYSTVDDSMYIFQPIAIETLGAFGSSAINFFNDLGHRMRAVSQDTRAGMFLMQRLSVAMQRGNAACILGTIADDDFSTEFFV